MAEAFIGLGSNLGDGKKNIMRAWQQLTALPTIRSAALSAPYFTSPVDMPSAQWFTNAVGKFTTTLSPDELLNQLLHVENDLGRKREQGPGQRKGGDRLIDLDILYYDAMTMTTGELILPHPEIQNRLFVLAPLAELAPDLPHPVLKKTTRQMLAELPASGQAVKKTSW